MQPRRWALFGVAILSGACSVGSLSSTAPSKTPDAEAPNDEDAASPSGWAGMSGATGDGGRPSTAAEQHAGGASGTNSAGATGSSGAHAGAAAAQLTGGASGSTEPAAVLDAGTSDASMPAPVFSVLTPGSDDSITTSAGAWRFGQPDPNGGGSVVFLNGAPAGLPFMTQFTATFRGSGAELVIENQSGRVYVRAMSGLWYTWNDVDQWTAQITGDPRSPHTPPALGPNLAGDSDFSNGLDELHSWFFAAQNDAACNASNGCSYALENVGHTPGGHSVHLVNHDHFAVLFAFFEPTVAETYLMSVWTKGLGGMALHEEHDSTGTMGAKIVPSTDWVQTLCTFKPVNPSNGQLLLKVYASDVNATDIYFGKVDASYPAPPCQKESPSVSIMGY